MMAREGDAGGMFTETTGICWGCRVGRFVRGAVVAFTYAVGIGVIVGALLTGIAYTIRLTLPWL